MKLKISPSLLDQYRVAYHGLYGKGFETVVDYLTKPREVNEAQSRGTAYHEMIEREPYIFESATPTGSVFYEVYEKRLGRSWIFHQEAVQPILDLAPVLEGMTFETWGRFEMKVNGYDVLMNMRYDGLKGLELHEFKTKGTAPKYEDYWNALQWQCYLLSLPEVNSVHYHIFHLGKGNEWCKYTAMQMDRYDGMEDNVRLYAGGLIAFLEGRPELLEKVIIKD